MSFLYRPTPVVNWNSAPAPPHFNPTLRGMAGQMRGYQSNINWKSFFDGQRTALQGDPWIVASGAMGSFDLSKAKYPYGLGRLGQDDGSDFGAPTDYTNLPLPTDIGGSLDTLSLPQSFFDLQAPAAPTITTPNMAAPDQNLLPGASAIPTITTGAPGGAAAPGSSSSVTSLIQSLTSGATNVLKAINPAINPTVAPVPPTAASSVAAAAAQAASLRAQAAALQASNPTLAAQYLAQANALAPSSMSTIAAWFSSPNSLFPSMSNGTMLLIGGAAVAAAAIFAGVKRR